MRSNDRYPRRVQIIHQPTELDGYVAATHERNEGSANAVELRDRRTGTPLAPPESFLSSGSSSQERGILRGIIALLEMSSEASSLCIFSTSENVTGAISGERLLQANADLVEEIGRIKIEKRIDLASIYCAKDNSRRVILVRLRRMAKEAIRRGCKKAIA